MFHTFQINIFKKATMITGRSLFTSYVLLTLSCKNVQRSDFFLKMLIIISTFFLVISYQLIDAKGFGGSRGGGGFKGGVAKGPGTFGGSASYNRPSGYGTNMGKV